MQDKSDVCIIGGGVVGLFTALLLARSGKSVCIIDKTYAASSRYNIGEIAPNGSDTILNPLIKLSQETWLQTAGATEEEPLGVKLRGRFEFSSNDDVSKVLQNEVEQENAQNIPTSYQTREQLEDLFQKDNYIALGPQVKGAKYIPEEPVIATKTCLRKLKAAVIKSGVKIWGSDEVSEFIKEGDKVIGVKTRQGDACHAEHIIITAGVFVSKLLNKLNISLPIRPARCHILHVTPNDIVPKQLIMARSALGHIYMKTNRHGRMMLTYDGLADAQQATYAITPNPATTMWLQGEAARLLPALANARIQEQTTVLLSVSPDYLPCIGPLKDYPNISVGIAMGGRSFAFAAGTAKCLTALISGQDAPVDISPFTPNRFLESTWQKTRLPGNLASVNAFIPQPPPTINMVEKHIQRNDDAEIIQEMTAKAEQATHVNTTGEKKVEGLNKDITDEADKTIEGLNKDIVDTESKNIEGLNKDIIEVGDKHIEGLDKDIVEIGDKKVEGLDKEIVQAEEKSYTVPGQIGFKEDKKKATMGKLGG